MSYNRKKTVSMPSRGKKQVKNSRVKQQSTPFGDSGQIVGKRLGSFFGYPKTGAMLGRAASSLVGRALFGSGDYNDNFSKVEVNSIINPQSTPKVFSMEQNAADSVCIRRTEYIQDIISSPTANTFATTTFNINPGQAATFPYLSNIARSFEEYRIKGMVYHFKSLAGDTAIGAQTGLGYVAIATQYDIGDATFTNKQALQNYAYAQSGKPTHDMIHGIECKDEINVLDRRFVRAGSVPSGSDPRFYDMGKTTIATSCPGTSVTLGELWVSYDIEFLKPKLPETSSTSGSQISRSNISSASITFGSIGLQSVGSIIATVNSSTEQTWVGLLPDQVYQYIFLIDTSFVFSVAPVITIAQGVPVNVLTNSGSTIDTVSTIQSVANSDIFIYVRYLKPSTAGTISFVLTTPGTVVSAAPYNTDSLLLPIDLAIAS